MVKILVVDDNPAQVTMLTAMLSRLDVECVTASTGLEAVQRAKALQPDLILMDWIMPVATLNGEAATRQLRGDIETQHIPIIACSAASNLADAMQVGCVDSLAKPFGLNAFVQVVRKYAPIKTA